MKISESDLTVLRPGHWPNQIPMDAIREARPDLLTDSWDAFAGLDSGTRDIVALLTFTGSVPPLSPDLDWVAISHQSGGLACDHPFSIGVVLDLRVSMRDVLRDLASSYYEAAGGHFYSEAVTISDLMAYSSRLEQLGLHCETSYRLFEEAVYPIDGTDEHLGLVANDPPTIEAFAGPCRFGHPAIVILADNSD